jgi:hypothetical protein
VKAVVAAGILVSCVLPAARTCALQTPNPFRELEAAEQKTDRHDPRALRELIATARRLTLPGSARRYARELLELEPNDELARELLHFRKFTDQKTQQPVWLDWFDAGLWQSYAVVRDETLGYHKPSDREAIRRGMLLRDGRAVSVADWDQQHREWSHPHEVDSRFFHFRSTIPLAAIWWVADDLDRLALSYLDYFEIERLPARRFTVNLYRTDEHAKQAHALVDLLTKYGAYYSPQEQVLHIIFERLGSITAVRHEVAHALNREFVDPNPPQWFDEGVGVTTQFARPCPDGSFEFGHFPKHPFGTKFVDEVQAGARERMAVIHSTGLVTTNSHYYSKFRAMIDFFMEAENQRYRMVFIDTLFRHRYDVAGLVAMQGIDDAWIRYVSTMKIDPDWSYRPPPEERAARIDRVLAAGSSAAAFPESDSSPNQAAAIRNPR